jgi:hypothetical protein
MGHATPQKKSLFTKIFLLLNQKGQIKKSI